MLHLYELISFSVINNPGMPSSELQTNFGVLQIDTENSATGVSTFEKLNFIVQAIISSTIKLRINIAAK